MADFTIRADSVDVEQIMRQIRGRIRDKRGVDYTEEQIRELAAAKLERFLDPTGVRSDLLEQFRKRPSLPPGFLYQFEDTTLFDSDKPVVRFFRRLLHPFLKLLFNPNVLSSTLHKQAAFNQYVHAHQPLQFELLHNLVLELTRASIEVKNLKMRLESVQSRLEFNERRARALEAVVQYKPDAPARSGRDDSRREPRGEGPRAQGTQPRFAAPPVSAAARPPQPQQQVRAPQPPVTASTAAAIEEEATPGTEPQGGTDPITGGDSLRTRRRRRRRGRRGAGEQGAETGRWDAGQKPQDGAGSAAGEVRLTPADAPETHDADATPDVPVTHAASGPGPAADDDDDPTRRMWDPASAGVPAAAPPDTLPEGESDVRNVRPDASYPADNPDTADTRTMQILPGASDTYGSRAGHEIDTDATARAIAAPGTSIDAGDDPTHRMPDPASAGLPANAGRDAQLGGNADERDVRPRPDATRETPATTDEPQ